MELNISVLSAALRREATGQPRDFRGDVVAVAKRNLCAGDMLEARVATRCGAGLCRPPIASALEHCRSDLPIIRNFPATLPAVPWYVAPTLPWMQVIPR
jgi:hypothetical protein